MRQNMRKSDNTSIQGSIFMAFLKWSLKKASKYNLSTLREQINQKLTKETFLKKSHACEDNNDGGMISFVELVSYHITLERGNKTSTEICPHVLF